MFRPFAFSALRTRGGVGSEGRRFAGRRFAGRRFAGSRFAGRRFAGRRFAGRRFLQPKSPHRARRASYDAREL